MLQTASALCFHAWLVEIYASNKLKLAAFTTETTEDSTAKIIFIYHPVRVEFTVNSDCLQCERFASSLFFKERFKKRIMLDLFCYLFT